MQPRDIKTILELFEKIGIAQYDVITTINKVVNDKKQYPLTQGTMFTCRTNSNCLEDDDVSIISQIHQRFPSLHFIIQVEQEPVHLRNTMVIRASDKEKIHI